MEYRRLGKSGLKVSALSFGAWVTFGKQVGDDVADACMSRAYEAGVNFFDNAEAYADGMAEKVMGDILKAKKWPRDSFIVSSKVFFGAERSGPNQRGLSRKHVTEACEAALKRLRVDYLDLYFCHRADPETPIEETVRTMNTLIEQGKILYWGTSEWTAREIEEAKRVADRHHLIGPTMEQPQYNMLFRDRVEKEYAPLYASRHGLGTTIWSPLASGYLTGKYLDGIPEGSRLALSDLSWLQNRFSDEAVAAKVRALKHFADKRDVPLHRFAIAWCLKNPNVSTVILGASRLSQLEDNLKSLEVVDLLDTEATEEIEQILDSDIPS
ncbi:MAG: aldo/keto reductase [Opitutales bacterium]|nr:aldo/keto reductase [Opitutales bacterium]